VQIGYRIARRFPYGPQMPIPTQKIRFCTSRDGTRIAYGTSGSGPPLVRAAHWISHLKLDWDNPVWRPWLSMLSRERTLITYDARGCGLSDREQVEFSLDNYVEDLEAVIGAAGVDHFALFGMAGGGSIAVTYAVRNPERVSHLVLHGVPAVSKLARGDLEHGQTEIKAFEFGWGKENPAFRQLFTSQLLPEATIEQFRAFNELIRLTTSPGNAARILRTLYDVDLRGIAPFVRCPTLVTHVREDARVPFEQGRDLAGLIPGARFVPLEGRNHVLLESEPAWQQFVDELDEFLPAAPNQSPGGPGMLFNDLTARESDVLELIAQGLDNGTIGARLGISEKTVRNRLSIILSKLGVNSRAQAIVRARDAGFGRKT
jgi:pimeloyl-ACP methyl ester carboxylesterase/DNA-binding CsgD family transcriptional regulator